MRPPIVRPRSIVLILEGDPATRHVLTRAIELEGYTAIVAASALDAYGVLAEHFDRIVLLVLGIAGSIGDAVAVRQLQLDAPRVAAIPAVVVSDRPLTYGERAQLQPTAMVVKPLRLEDARNILFLPDDHRSGALSANETTNREWWALQLPSPRIGLLSVRSYPKASQPVAHQSIPLTSARCHVVITAASDKISRRQRTS